MDTFMCSSWYHCATCRRTGAKGRSIRASYDVLAAGRHLHRRHRARHHAPDLHALLHQGAAATWAGRLRRADAPAPQPGHHPGRGRREDVEDARQRGRARRAGRRLRRRHRPRLPDVLRALGAGRAVVVERHRGRVALAAPRLVAGGRRGAGRGREPARPRASARCAAACTRPSNASRATSRASSSTP